MSRYIAIRQDLERCVFVFIDDRHTFGFHCFRIHVAVGIYTKATIGILERICRDLSANSNVIRITALAVRIVFYSSFVQFIEIALNLTQLAFCRRTIRSLRRSIPSCIGQAGNGIFSIGIDLDISGLNAAILYNYVALFRLHCNASRRTNVTVVIDMEARVVVLAADPQAVFAQRVMGTFRIAGVESVFVDHRILVSRTCHATVFASLRVVVNGLFTVFCGSRHRSRCFNQFYHRRRSFVVVNGAVQLFIIQLFERWISCLSRHSAYPCRQYQCSQYSCSAPACAARCTLRAAVGKF